MSIKIVSHALEWKQAVLDFNQRMRDGGSHWGFYVDPDPDWIPKRPGTPTWREYYLAIEDENIVRGGYALKPQQWWVRGEVQWVADWQGPFSEGAVNIRYGALGLRMLRDMLKKQPLLYSLGHGGSDEPIVQMLRTLGWTLHAMPFCLRVVRPYRFLKLNKYLRSTPSRERWLDRLAESGVGTLGLLGLHVGIGLKSPRLFEANTTVETEFGPWADELWERCRNRYACVAVRNAPMMNALVPQRGWPTGIRLRVSKGEHTIGWAVVMHKQMKEDARFGDLHVGLIADAFAAPEDTAEVVHAAYRFLESTGVDMVYSNQSHPSWIEGFEASGFVILPRRRLFAISPGLQALFEPMDELLPGLHLTNMDGHGPHGFD